MRVTWIILRKTSIMSTARQPILFWENSALWNIVIVIEIYTVELYPLHNDRHRENC